MRHFQLTQCFLCFLFIITFNPSKLLNRTVKLFSQNLSHADVSLLKKMALQSEVLALKARKSHLMQYSVNPI